jgi:hypothetical protein
LSTPQPKSLSLHYWRQQGEPDFKPIGGGVETFYPELAVT